MGQSIQIRDRDKAHKMAVIDDGSGTQHFQPTRRANIRHRIILVHRYTHGSGLLAYLSTSSKYIHHDKEHLPCPPALPPVDWHNILRVAPQRIVILTSVDGSKSELSLIEQLFVLVAGSYRKWMLAAEETAAEHDALEWAEHVINAQYFTKLAKELFFQTKWKPICKVLKFEGWTIPSPASEF